MESAAVVAVAVAVVAAPSAARCIVVASFSPMLDASNTTEPKNRRIAQHEIEIIAGGHTRTRLK